MLLMKLGIQIHLAALSLSNTALFVKVFSIDRVRPTVHNRADKADLKPDSGRSRNHVAANKNLLVLTIKNLLYAAINKETNYLLHIQLEPTMNNALAHQFFADLRDKHDIDDATVLVDGSSSIQRACRKQSLDFKYERHGNRNSVKRSLL